MKKIIGIFICTLLILTMIPLSTTADEPTRKTIYVNASGGADYKTIQDAVNHANDGDTIYVYSGTYNENVNIGVSINLVGEDKETTIVDGGGNNDVIYVAAKDVSISGFTIQNSGKIGNHGGIDIHLDNCVITDNIFINHELNAILIRSSFNSITYNTISNVNYAIHVENNYNNTISGNTITDVGAIAIFLERDSKNNNICNNNIYGSIAAIQISGSSSNNIFKNHLHDNQDGLVLQTCSNNLIYENVIEENWGDGIDANYKSGDNYIYNNNFLNNTYNAADYTGNDSWENGYPIGGNYWSDYTGVDSNGDGIGDTQYQLGYYPNFNYDKYPLMEPFGGLRVNPCGPYCALTNNPIQFTGFACGGSPPYNWHWNFGDGTKSDEQNPSHTYTKIGKYTVTLVVNDEKNTEVLSTYAWIQKTNTPPNKPIISGSKKVHLYKWYYYQFMAIDPDLGLVYYYVDWGDGGTNTGWIGPFNSGDTQTLSHYWNKQGSYIVKAKAKDLFGEESGWATLQLSAPRTKTNQVLIQLLELLQKLFPRLSNILDLIK